MEKLEKKQITSIEDIDLEKSLVNVFFSLDECLVGIPLVIDDDSEIENQHLVLKNPLILKNNEFSQPNFYTDNDEDVFSFNVNAVITITKPSTHIIEQYKSFFENV